jgi:hypothetical protein
MYKKQAIPPNNLPKHPFSIGIKIATYNISLLRVVGTTFPKCAT